MKRISFLFLTVAAASLLWAGCSKSAPKEADLNSVMDAMKEKIANTQMMDLSSGDLMPNYGIAKEDVRQFAALVDSTGTKGDEILLFEGSSADAAGRIRERLDDRYRQKEIEMKDYLPEEYAVLKKCGVEVSGDYVALIVSPQADELEQIYRGAFR